jgi:hypothetical protein
MSSPPGKTTPITHDAAARIQGAAARAHGGETESGSFAASVQSAADRSVAAQEKQKQQQHQNQQQPQPQSQPQPEQEQKHM